MEKNLKKYYVCTCIVFVCFLLLIGASMQITKSQTIITIMKMASAWSPTIVFVFMFHKIYPDKNFFSFLKLQFKERVQLSTVFCILGLFCLVVVGRLFVTSIYSGMPMSAILVSSPIFFVTSFFYNLVWGPTGEELGWRGYMLNQLQKIHSPLKSAVILGGLWGFWHIPMCLVDGGYSGLKLVQYIVIVCIECMALSIIIAAFYNLNHNLIIPILIHQLNNYLTWIQVNDGLYMMTLNAIFYSIVAVILVLVNYKKCLYGKCAE